MLSPENRSWLDDFRKTHGRVPRVLHIGNIANNAYNNAKILNEAGLENYVLCYDYYHIMACPEWEDADFSAFFGDQFTPEWYKLDLNGFQRPSWFIQGPLDLGLRALQTNIKKCSQSQLMQRACLSASNVIPPSVGEGAVSWFTMLQRGLLEIIKSKQTVFGLLRWLHRSGKYIYYCFRYPFYASKVNRLFGQEFNITTNSGAPLEETAAKTQMDVKSTPSATCMVSKTRVSLSDLIPYLQMMRTWDKTAPGPCDFVVAYSTDPILPMLHGQDYFAFEHGTIREIPYQRTPVGPLTALAYRRAQHVFVTNFDCRASADFLAPGRYTTINHPFDEDHGQRVTRWEELRRSLQQELDSDLLLFHPTRQDWVEGTGYADKANDRFLKAFCELRNQGLKIGLVCCEWGGNVPSSKQLIAGEQCSEYVKWVQPLPVVAFERTCLACDVVVDQFKLGSFGGVLFKAMAVGRPILTFLDEKQVMQQYAECPPVLNCRTQKEIADTISRVFCQRDELERLGRLSREWIRKHHGKAATVNAQVDQFRLFDLSRHQRGKGRQPSLG